MNKKITEKNENLEMLVFKIKKLYEKQEMRKEKNAEKVHNIHQSQHNNAGRQ